MAVVYCPECGCEFSNEAGLTSCPKCQYPLKTWLSVMTDCDVDIFIKTKAALKIPFVGKFNTGGETIMHLTGKDPHQIICLPNESFTLWVSGYGDIGGKDVPINIEPGKENSFIVHLKGIISPKIAVETLT